MYVEPGKEELASKPPPDLPSIIVCDPPLGHPTVISSETKEVTFTVLIEESRDSHPWELALWHNFSNVEIWESLDFHHVKTKNVVPSFGRWTGDAATRRYVTATFPNRPDRSGPVEFTIRFRESPSQKWRWVNDHKHLNNGVLFYQSGKPLSATLHDYFGKINPDVTVKAQTSEAPETSVWSLTAAVSHANGRTSGYDTITIGVPRDFGPWMAIVRHWTPWLSPEHGTDKFSPVKDVILCSFLRHDGTHLVLLALSGVDNVLNVLRSDEDGNVICAARNDSTEMGIARIIASVGTDYESAVAAVMYHARRVIQEEGVTSDDAEEEAKAFLDGVKPEWMENWYDGLTYCTWNGLGQNLSEQKVVDALRSLKQQNVNITNLIIDDNWQSLDNVGSSQFIQGWAEFEANKQGFPNGLKEAITKIREEHSYIQHIAVWHALLGYWGGIAPNSKLDKTYKTIDVRMKKAVRPPGGMMRVVAEEDVKRFYEDFYKFLLDAGIDSVKTDAQFFLDTLDDADDRRSLIKAYQDAWTVSSLRWFSIKAISCMSQTPQILFHSQLPMNRPRILVRNSGDFYPDVPESHPWHIFCNAHNSLLTQNLNLLPDWDMFQTAHPWASFHAAARCVSGGPVYITDEPNKHDLEIIHQMTAQSVRGSTVILRPAVGRTTQQYLNYHAARLLKIGTYVGMASTGTGILGVFNISTAPLTELLQLSEFPGVHTDEEYVVRAHSTGAVSGVMATPSLLSIDVALHGWEILSAHPIQTLGDKKVAPLGLVGKMTGVAAIVNSTSQLQPSGRVHMSIALKALGVLGIYISTLPTITPEDEILILILGKVIPLHTVRAREEVLEIDVLRAWTEMDLSAGWGNEVVVEVFVS